MARIEFGEVVYDECEKVPFYWNGKEYPFLTWDEFVNKFNVKLSPSQLKHMKSPTVAIKYHERYLFSIKMINHFSRDPEGLVRYFTLIEPEKEELKRINCKNPPHFIIEDFIRNEMLKAYKFNETLDEAAAKNDKEFDEYLKLHKRYKRRYYLGMFLWMTSCFWVPFIIGMLSGIDVSYKYFKGVEAFYCLLVSGFEYILLASFTYAVTFPLSLFMGVYVHPRVLKSLMFNDKNPYNEGLMDALGTSKATENNNAKAVLAGTVLGKIID